MGKKETMPILIMKGDSRLLIGGYPPRVACRVIAEELYQKMIKAYTSPSQESISDEEIEKEAERYYSTSMRQRKAFIRGTKWIGAKTKGNTEEGWISVEDKTPIAYETGDWDGQRSDLFLCEDVMSEYHLAHLYEYHDGQVEWYDKEDFGLRHEIVKWMPLPH